MSDSKPNKEEQSQIIVGDKWGEKLPRRLGLFSAAAVLVGTTIGSGIFRSPADIAQYVDSPGLFAGVWIIGGLVALAGALSLAELAAMFPRSGGIYVYLRESLGPMAGFLFGWAQLVLLRPASLGAISLTSAEYCCRLLGIDGHQKISGWPVSGAQAIAIMMIIVVGTVNYRGVHRGALLQNVSTVMKIAALSGLIGIGLILGTNSVDTNDAVNALVPAGQSSFEGGVLAGVGMALVSVLWAYDGWSDAGFIAGEVRHPQRNLPKSFIMGTLVVIALYLAINWVYLSVVGLSNMPGRPLIAADVARSLLGPLGGAMIAGVVMLSTFGALNGSMMVGPRVFYAMAQDGLLLGRLGYVHPVYRSPAGAILLAMALGIIFVSIRSFEELANSFVIGMWPFYTTAIIGVLVLRRRMPQADRPYRVIAYPWIVWLFIAAALFLLGNYMVSEPAVFFGNLAFVALGIPIYMGVTARQRSIQRRKTSNL